MHERIVHNDIHIIEGSVPILLSAPHAGVILKNGKNKHEPRVGTIVRRLCRDLGTWGVFVTPERLLPRWKEELYPVYKEVVRDIIRTQRIALFIDIHGAQRSFPFWIDYDFLAPPERLHEMYRQRVGKEHVPPQAHALDDILETIIQKNFERHFPNPQKPLTKSYLRSRNGFGRATLAYRMRKRFGMPTLQLEINRKLRDDKELFGQTMAFLADTIQEYKSVLHYENTPPRV